MHGVRIIEGVAGDRTCSPTRRRGHRRAHRDRRRRVRVRRQLRRHVGPRARRERTASTIPQQAAEHYYLITDTDRRASTRTRRCSRTPPSYGYYREEGGGLMVGLFEPSRAPWKVDGIPRDFSFGEIPPDWDRMGPYLEKAMARVPVTLEVGIRTFFCGPECFTPDLAPVVGEAPEHPQLLRRRRAELDRHPHRRRPRPGAGALDHRRPARRRRHRLQHRPVPRLTSSNPSTAPTRTVESSAWSTRATTPGIAAADRARRDALAGARPAGRARAPTSATSAAGRAPTGTPAAGVDAGAPSRRWGRAAVVRALGGRAPGRPRGRRA